MSGRGFYLRTKRIYSLLLGTVPLEGRGIKFLFERNYSKRRSLPTKTNVVSLEVGVKLESCDSSSLTLHSYCLRRKGNDGNIVQNVNLVKIVIPIVVF